MGAIAHSEGMSRLTIASRRNEAVSDNPKCLSTWMTREHSWIYLDGVTFPHLEPPGVRMLFVCGTGEGIHVPTAPRIFKHGVRLDAPTVRRMRAILSCLTRTLGMESHEIAKLRTVTPRQIRSVRARLEGLTAEDLMGLMGTEIATRYPRWRHKVRDACIGLLCGLGMDPEDASVVLRFQKHAADIRQSIIDLPPSIASQVSLAAHRILQTIGPRVERLHRERAVLISARRESRRASYNARQRDRYRRKREADQLAAVA